MTLAHFVRRDANVRGRVLASQFADMKRSRLGNDKTIRTRQRLDQFAIFEPRDPWFRLANRWTTRQRDRRAKDGLDVVRFFTKLVSQNYEQKNKTSAIRLRESK